MEGASVKPSDVDSISGLYSKHGYRALILSLLLLLLLLEQLPKAEVTSYRATVIPCHCKPGCEYFL